MRLASLPQVARNAARFGEIVAVLGRYGLAGWLRASDPEFVTGLLRGAEGERLAGRPLAERLRLALAELGPAFIKLGQVLSTREDLVGPEIAAELAQLRERTTPDAPDVARATVEQGLGRAVADVFAAFDAVPFASASIGQVHAATLPDGRPVVVKVRRHEVERAVLRDLDVLAALAQIAEHHEELRLYRPAAIVEDFRRTIVEELDYTRERANLERFTAAFAGDERVRFPRPFDEISCSTVLVMERLDGMPVDDPEALRAAGIDPTEVARRGAGVWLDMIFREGFYHADPHPGNIRVLPDGTLGLLDCGMAGRVDEPLREAVEDLLIALASQEGEAIVDAIVAIAETPESLDRAALARDAAEYAATYGGASVDELDLGAAISDFTALVRRHRVLLPGRVALLLRVIVMLEGTSRGLDRSFSLAELLAPYRDEMIRRRLAPARLLKEFARAGRDWQRLGKRLPRRLDDLLARLERGRLDVRLTHRRAETTVNRLVQGIVVAALLVSSALLLAAETPPRLLEVSVPGAIGLLVAILLGLELLRAVRRSGGLTRDGEDG